MATREWVAGWNLPGYLPEMDPAFFETEAEAEAFIAEERERVADGDYGDDYKDPYVYWVERVIG